LSGECGSCIADSNSQEAEANSDSPGHCTERNLWCCLQHVPLWCQDQLLAMLAAPRRMTEPDPHLLGTGMLPVETNGQTFHKDHHNNCMTENVKLHNCFTSDNFCCKLFENVTSSNWTTPKTLKCMDFRWRGAKIADGAGVDASGGSSLTSTARNR